MAKTKTRGRWRGGTLDDYVSAKPADAPRAVRRRDVRQPTEAPRGGREATRDGVLRLGPAVGARFIFDRERR